MQRGGRSPCAPLLPHVLCTTQVFSSKKVGICVLLPGEMAFCLRWGRKEGRVVLPAYLFVRCSVYLPEVKVQFTLNQYRTNAQLLHCGRQGAGTE